MRLLQKYFHPLCAIHKARKQLRMDFWFRVLCCFCFKEFGGGGVVFFEIVCAFLCFRVLDLFVWVFGYVLYIVR